MIGPVPNWYKTKDAIRVVTFASIMVVSALSYPESIAAFGVFPLRSSSLILSKIITLASMDIPTVRIKPAIPGSVRVACNDAKTAKTYLGNVNVVWTNGENVDAAPRDAAAAPPPPPQPQAVEEDLPF